MTGEEHAELAEALSLGADETFEMAVDQHGVAAAQEGFFMAVARAQVHATLALVDAVKALAPQDVQMKYSDPGSSSDRLLPPV
ncbi:hypothetical protein [Amycolatopsis speibonae]|uniref:Uncharacterized protein n=1 Tax=Amycolatopsis speibonae TaxID=1450224 RepID=A0ABV7P6H1_9PSEU